MVNVVRKKCGHEGCSTKPLYGVAGSKKAKFCSKHARSGMVNVVRKKCGHEGCSTKPSYGVAGSKKAEFCSKHARSEMVNVVLKKCNHEGCSTKPSHGVAGSKKAEFCSKHAGSGMMSVVHRKCGYEGCSTHPSYGVAGSKKAEFCSKHARAGTMNVVSETCGYEGCSTKPLYGVAGSKKAEFCSEHARSAMVNVVDWACGHEDCFANPSYGVAGSVKAEFCPEQARSGMGNVVHKMCGYEGCSTHPSHGVTGSNWAGFSFKHSRAGMVNVVGKKCGEDEWFKLTVEKRHTVDEAEICRQHTSPQKIAAAPDTAKLETEEGAPVRSPTKDGGRSVADVRGTKRKRARFWGSVSNDGVGARRSASAGARQFVTTRNPASRAGEMSSEARAGDWMKVELAVRPATDDGDRGREDREQARCSSGDTNAGRRSSVSCTGMSSGRLCASPAMARERLGMFHVDLEQAEEYSNVKIDLGVSGPSPRAYDTL
ncbi:unnamed protein product [Sphacelaria rigidula]